MRMRHSYRQMHMRMGRMGDVTTMAAQLASYTAVEIVSAFNTLQTAYQSENSELVQMSQWATTPGNMQTLTPDGKQQYLQALQTKTQVVNGLSDGVTTFASVLSVMGLDPSSSGMSGYYPRASRLGVFPVAIVAVVVAIIAIVIGVGVYEHYQTLSAQANAQAEQAKSMQQTTAQVPALIAAGWTADQIQKYVTAVGAGQQGVPKTWASDIPWTTLGIAAALAVGVKALFG